MLSNLANINLNYSLIIGKFFKNMYYVIIKGLSNCSILK